MPSALLFLLASILTRQISATPLQLEDQISSLENLQDVEKRCSNPCGYYGQMCCPSNEVCYTDSNNQAQCGSVVAASQTTGEVVAYLTSTYVLTDESTCTTTFYSTMAAVPTQSSCAITCGYSCCLSGQYCNSNTECAAIGGSSLPYSSLYTVTTYLTSTANPTAGIPLRPTSSTVTTVTYTGSATITQPYNTPVSTSGILLSASQSSGGGLSGGAIAGIVIGVILAIIILLLICLCCCAKEVLESILGIFGLGSHSRRRTEETEVIEERHHSGGGGGRTWFGASRPSRRTDVVEKSSGGGWGGLAGVAAALGGLGLLLKLKRNRDEKNDKSSYGYGSEYYSTEYTSSSELDRR
jgi:hypothetical protein